MGRAVCWLSWSWSGVSVPPPWAEGGWLCLGVNGHHLDLELGLFLEDLVCFAGTEPGKEHNPQIAADNHAVTKKSRSGSARGGSAKTPT